MGSHSVIPATWQRWFSHIYSGVLPVHIYRPRKDETLSWPRWLVIPRWFPRPQTVTHPNINRARCRVTMLMETNALPLSHATTPTPVLIPKANFKTIYFVLSITVMVYNVVADVIRTTNANEFINVIQGLTTKNV